MKAAGIVLLVPMLVMAFTIPAPCEPHVVMTLSATDVVVSATCEAGAAASSTNLTYRLETKREGASGTATSRQSGLFQFESDSTIALSTQRISIQRGDVLDSRLEILAGQEVLAVETSSFTVR